MSEEEYRSDLVLYWWSKAEESLSSAKREFEAASYSITMNRLYYSVFYGVSAALFERGHSFKKHSGIRSAFHREFIRTGLMDIKYGKLYDQLFEPAFRSLRSNNLNLLSPTLWVCKKV